MPHLHHAALATSQSVFLTLIIGFTAVVYLRGWLFLRSGCVKRIAAWRAVSFIVGLLMIWVAEASPVAALDHDLLTVHMLQHLLLMTFVPPLIWLGAPLGPLLHGLPSRLIGGRRLAGSVRVASWRSRGARRVAEILGSAKFAWFAASAALVGWHIPKLLALGMQSVAWHQFEQLSFLVTGLLFWRPVVQRTADSPRQDLSMILYLFFATLPCDILSGFLVFSDRVVYPIYFSSPHLLGFSPLVDQQCAAALMWTCVTIVYFVAGAILTTRFLSPKSISQSASAKSNWPGAAIPRHVSQGLEVL